jgi:predicted GIY-YIG superfamily endonuclease
MKPFFAYMLRCSDGSFYVGHTDELEMRVAQHECGELEGYTSTRRPVVLVWSEEFPTREEALEVELQLKGWTRAKKEALIRGDFALIKRLARGPNRSERVKKSAPVRSPFDSGPAGGRPYAQGERGSSERGLGSAPGAEAQGEQGQGTGRGAEAQRERGQGTGRGEQIERGLMGMSSRDHGDPTTSFRPERCGRAAAAESKDERSRI